MTPQRAITAVVEVLGRYSNLKVRSRLKAPEIEQSRLEVGLAVPITGALPLGAPQYAEGRAVDPLVLDFSR